jgi:hypothetical protein
VGVSGGDAKLVNAIRMLLHAHPLWVVVQLDLMNAFNEVQRAAVLRAFLAVPTLAHLVPFLRAVLAPASTIRLGENVQLSDEGLKQGMVFGSAGFCVAIHEDVVWLDEQLGRCGGGCALFGADDGYVLGPPCAELWEAIAQFTERVRAKGLELQMAKSACFCPASDDIEGRPEGLPIGTLEHYKCERAPAGCVPPDDRAAGVVVFNVPVGTSAFVQSILGSKAARVGGNFTKLQVELHPVSHNHTLWTAMYYSLSHQFDFWLRNCFPDDVLPHAEHVDRVMLSTLTVAWGVDVRECPRALRRLRMPVRQKGAGLRDSVALLRHAAFIGGVAPSLRSFLDVHEDSTGACVSKGICPGLAAVLGDRAFAAGESEPLAQFFAGNSPTATALARSWEALQQLAGRSPTVRRDEYEPTALIWTPARGVAHESVCEKGQSALTKAVEEHQLALLRAEFEALGPGHREHRLWRSLDGMSSVWLTTLPDEEGRMPGRVLAEIAARYFFQPSPALRPHVGKRIVTKGNRGSRRVILCDAYGDALCAATLPGDGHRQHHDTAENEVLVQLRRHAIRADAEVIGLFLPAVPERYREGLANQTRGKIPDIRAWVPTDARGTVVRDTLMEVKTMHYSEQRYNITRSGQRAGVLPVERRAAGLQGEYDKALQAADQRWCGSTADEIGPMRAVLRSHERLHGLVFGCVAEASKDVHKLIKTMAYAAADGAMLATGAKTHKAAVASLKLQARRTIGCAVWRSIIGMLFDREMYIDGMGGVGGGQHNDGSGQRSANARSMGRRSTTASYRYQAAARDKGSASAYRASFSD